MSTRKTQKKVVSTLALMFVLPLPLHIRNRVENVLKHIIFHVHDIKVIADKIGLPIRKLTENTFFYQILSQTKTRKRLLTELKTKHNAIVL